MQRTDSLEKTLMLGQIEGRRRWGRHLGMVGWVTSWDGMVGGHNQLNEFDQTLGDSEVQEIMAVCHPWDHKASDMT